MRILVVEDDERWSSSLREQLKEFVVDFARTAVAAGQRVNTYEYNVIVMDMVLPDGNGVELCKDWRRQDVLTPILMLTGNGSLEDKIASFNAGADDYLTKPFSFAELKARVIALGKRAAVPVTPTMLKVGELVFDTIARKVTHKGKVLKLRRKGLLILEYLMRHTRQTVTREMLTEHIWESGHDPMSNTIDVHIRYLREKVDKPFGTHLIKTVHGLGYVLEE